MDKVEVGRGELQDNGSIVIFHITFHMERGEFVKRIKEDEYVRYPHDSSVIFHLDNIVIYSVIQNPSTLKVLIEEDLIPDSFKKDLLPLSCHEEKYDSVKILLNEGGVDVNYIDKGTGGNIFCLIPPRDESEIINILKFLSIKGIDLASKNHKECTFLHYLASIKRITDEYFDLAREFLLEASYRGSDYVKEIIDEEDGEGNTALILAAKSKRIRILKEILRYNPDTEHVNNKGKSFWNYFSSTEEAKMIREFIEVLNMHSLNLKKGIPRKGIL